MSGNKRERLVVQLADHVVEHGLAGSGLRALARSAGTSDRMLLYYFADKNELLTAVFTCVAERIEAILGSSAPVAPASPDELLEELWARSHSENLQPYVDLLIELAAASVRQGEPYVGAAKAIAKQFQDWIADRLNIENERDRQKSAHRIMATLDGLALLKAIGSEPGDTLSTEKSHNFRPLDSIPRKPGAA